MASNKNKWENCCIYFPDDTQGISISKRTPDIIKSDSLCIVIKIFFRHTFQRTKAKKPSSWNLFLYFFVCGRKHDYHWSCTRDGSIRKKVPPMEKRKEDYLGDCNRHGQGIRNQMWGACFMNHDEVYQAFIVNYFKSIHMFIMSIK